MWELTKRIQLKTSSALSEVEPEPELYTGSGSDQKVLAPTGSGSATLPKHWRVGRLGIRELALCSMQKIMLNADAQWHSLRDKIHHICAGLNLSHLTADP